LYFTWICIGKKKLSNQILTTDDVSKYINIDKILKFNLGYNEVSHIRTFPIYLNWFQKYVFAMIK